MSPSYQQIIFLQGVEGTGMAMHPLSEALALNRPAAYPDELYSFDMGRKRPA